MGEVSILVYAYGALFGLSLLEMGVSHLRKDGHYRVSDLNASLSMAISYQLFELFTRGFMLWPYVSLATWSPWQLPMHAFWAWGIGFVLVDLVGYTSHRLMHEVNFLWAFHEGHHSGEELNLGMGPRQSFFVGLVQPVFALPLAFFVPVQMLVALHAFELLWALFLHTPYVGKLGLLEEVLSTPSHHRVHHGRNAKYIDRNHGNVLIIWDRLFGTFQREEETPVYGITSILPARGVWELSTHRFTELWQMARATRRLKDKLGLWFKPPTYRPLDLGGPVALVDTDLRRYRVPNTQAPGELRVYTTFQFLFALSGLPWLILTRDGLPFHEQCLFALLILWALSSLTCLLEERAGAARDEALRVLVTAAALSVLLERAMTPWLWLSALVSMLGLCLVTKQRSVRSNSQDEVRLAATSAMPSASDTFGS